jgi:hypothetical protein
LSLFTLVAVPLAMLAARSGEVGRRHSAMIWLYGLALVVTGPSGPGGSCTPSCSGRELRPRAGGLHPHSLAAAISSSAALRYLKLASRVADGGRRAQFL